jgi:ubiquitin-protein ligase
METKTKVRALKRIQRDLSELETEPLEGVGIAKIDKDNDFIHVVNIKIQYGIYEGILLQFKLTIPESFPVQPPEMLMYPSQPFDHSFHHHIYFSNNGFKSFCIDILGNAMMETNTAKTGWSSGYTLKTLFMQVQNFLGDPDMSHLPGEREINYLKKQLAAYSREFIDENGQKVNHTYEKPYPALGVNKMGDQKILDTNEKKLKHIKEALTCYHTKVDYLSDKKMVLGYPLMITKNLKDNIEINPIPELLSYEGYISNIQTKPYKLESFFDVQFKTAMGEPYNYWLPIYIDEEHYQNNKGLILNSISVCKYGIQGIKEYDFKPLDVIDILPTLLNKMIIFLIKGSTHLSNSAMEAYCHYIMLINRLIEDFPEIKNHLEKLIKELNEGSFNKTTVPDIGNFVVLLFFSKVKITELFMYKLLNEFFTRQMVWNFGYKETRANEEIKKFFFDDENLKTAYMIEKFTTQKFIKINDPILMNHKAFMDKREGQFIDFMYCKNPKRADMQIFLDKHKFFRCLAGCEKKTVEKVLSLLYERRSGNKLLLFTFKAAEKFINDDAIKKLKENYCVLGEDENAQFVKELNELKIKVDSYRKLVNELGYWNFFPKSDDLYYLLNFIYTSDLQGYTYGLTPKSVVKYFKLD